GHLERLMDFICGLHRQGHTILLISHDEKLVYHYVERMVVMREGRIAADGALRLVRTSHASTVQGSLGYGAR
ncbi:MAG: hypothetical protein ACP5TV_06320, partial [Anaerolineae bacterium]